MGGFRYGRPTATRRPKQFKTTSFQAVFDTGASLIYIPQSIATSFFTTLLSGKKAQLLTDDPSYYLATCDLTKWEPVAFYLGTGQWVEVHPSTYIIEVQASP